MPAMAESDYQFIVASRVAQGAYPKPLNEHFAKFHTIVFCAEEMQPKVRGLPPDRRAVYCPMDDNFYRPVTREEIGLLMGLAKQLAVEAKEGRKVLITCAQGVNRSGLVTGMTVMHLTGCTGDQAIAEVRRLRKPRLRDIMVLGNPMFEQALRSIPKVAKV